MLEFVPFVQETEIVISPSLVWSKDGTGFYTYIPVSPEAPKNDKIGGHIWYIPLKGNAQDLGKPKLKAKDQVIPSPGGEGYLIGSGEKWEIHNMKTGVLMQTLPPVATILSWTPDGKGIAYTAKTGAAQYLGMDGLNRSAYVPDAQDLFAIKWLPNDTIFYVAKGTDAKLNFSSVKLGETPIFRGILPSLNAFNVMLFAAVPGAAKAPAQCVETK